MSGTKEATFLMRLVDLVSSPLKGISNVAGEATKKLNETTGAAARLGKGGAGGGDFFGKLKSGVSGFSKELGAAAGEVPGLNRALELVTNPYVAVAAGVVGVGLALKNATGRAMDFEQGMAKINTTARLGKPELDELRNRLLSMGADSTVPLAEIPDAFNQILSAVGNSKDALAMFAPALRASQGGFVDIRTAGDAAANVIGAAGLKAGQAAEVFDVLQASVRLGKGEFRDFAQYFPKILPLSQNVGLGYKEVAGAFALMTSKGQTAEQATTLLQNTVQALGKSEVIYGTKSQLGFQRSGIAVFDHQQKMRKLVDIIGDVNKKTQGMTDQQRQAFLSGLGLDQQAAAGFSILAQNAQEMRKFVKGTTNSAGEMEEAYKRSLNPSARLKMLLNQWDLVMTKIGYKILPYVNEGLEWGLSFVNKIKANSEGIGNYFGAAVAPIRLMWSGLKGVWNTLNWISELGGTGSMGSMIERLFGGSGGVWKEIKGFLDNFFEYLNVALGAIDDVSEGHFKKAGQRFDDFSKKLDIIRRGGIVGDVTVGKSADFADFFGLATKRADEDKKHGPGSLTSALAGQNKGADIQGDGGKARIVNTRIDKIEVIVKVANAAGQGMQDLGNAVARVIVGSLRDSEIILSHGN
jgi:TP901 family phage tail tape measure protein